MVFARPRFNFVVTFWRKGSCTENLEDLLGDCINIGYNDKHVVVNPQARKRYGIYTRSGFQYRPRAQPEYGIENS